MKNRTALVTGASDGLGKFFALELAKRNIDLVLIALPSSGLPELAQYIQNNFTVSATYFEVNLAKTESITGIYEQLKKAQQRVHILINNAGVGNWSWFEEKHIDFYKTQIDLNVTGTVLLTRLFLEQADRYERSYILNVGSLGSKFIVPKKPVYGATKSFVGYFTKCLQLEMAQSNVHISLLSPGGINTKPELLVMNHRLKGISRATILEPEDVARIAIAGMLKGRKEIIPGAINKMLVVLNHLLPPFLKTLIIKRNLKTILKTEHAGAPVLKPQLSYANN